LRHLHDGREDDFDVLCDEDFFGDLSRSVLSGRNNSQATGRRAWRKFQNCGAIIVRRSDRSISQ
jgi:hypothetical protein